MYSIAVFNQKGGVGKTVCTVNLAACLDREMRKKVLVVDLDSQCNATTYLTAFAEAEPLRTVIDYIEGTKLADIAQPVFEMSGRTRVATKMRAVAGSRQMNVIETSEHDVFSRLVSEAEEMGFDYVFFDCPADLTGATLLCLRAVNGVIVPATSDIDSIGGYDMLIDTVQDIRKTSNVGLRILGVFFNDIHQHESLDQYMYNTNVQSLGDAAFKHMIRSSALVRQAKMLGKPLAYFRPSSDVYGDFKALTKEMVNRIKKGDR